MIVWPEGLPWINSLTGLELGSPNGDRIEVQNDAGEPKVRLITTAAWEPIKGVTPVITLPAFSTFLTFYENDLDRGTAAFGMTHPLDAVPRVFKFTEGAGYGRSPVGAGKLRLQLSMRCRTMTAAELVEYAAA